MRYKKSELSAGQIVAAAIRVLSRQGYARTSLMDIAREAGMSKGAVHYHFPTKDALIQVVLETACDSVAQRTMTAWQAGDNPFESIRSSLAELWKVRVERTPEARVIADLLAQSQYDEVLRPKLAAYYRYAASQVHEAITPTLLAAGLTPKVSPEILPRILLGLLDGLVMQVFVDDDVLSEDDVVTAVLAVAQAMFEFAPVSP